MKGAENTELSIKYSIIDFIHLTNIYKALNTYQHWRYNAEQKMERLGHCLHGAEVYMVVRLLKWLQKLLALGSHTFGLCPSLECGWNLTCF